MIGFLNNDTDVFGWPTIAVDTHFFRVSNRNQLVIGKNVDSVEQKLWKVISAEFKVDVHIMRH
jgi:endonuclease-3